MEYVHKWNYSPSLHALTSKPSVHVWYIYWNQALKRSWSFVRVYKYSIGMTVIKLWLGMKERGIRQQCHGFRAHLWMIQWGPRILAHGRWDPVESMESGKENQNSSKVDVFQLLVLDCLLEYLEVFCNYAMKPWFISEIITFLCLSLHAGKTKKSLCPLNPIVLTSNWVEALPRWQIDSHPTPRCSAFCDL